MKLTRGIMGGKNEGGVPGGSIRKEVHKIANYVTLALVGQEYCMGLCEKVRPPGIEQQCKLNCRRNSMRLYSAT